jgi:site-specific DNA-methyltransferase (adenine-specific)
MRTEPYYQDKWVTIYHGDCREALPQLDVKVDLVLTDPPYGLNYKGFDWDITVPYEMLPIFLGMADTVVWFASSGELARDLKSFTPSPDRILIWYPKFTLSHTIKNGIAYRYQPIHVWGVPSEHNVKWDVLDTPTECGNWWKHYATKPKELMKMLATFAKETILDPYMGSGTTLVAGKELNRKCIGIEIEEKYCEIAAKRCSQEVMELNI